MLKNIITLIVLTMIAVYLFPYSDRVVSVLMSWYQEINHLYGLVLSNTPIGGYLNRVFAILTLPLLIAGAIAGGYWLVRKKTMPYAVHILWGVWIVLVTALAVR